jgi:hypothetical protein
VNGAYNCAPAVVAMLARGHGKLGDLNDAQLIQRLGQDIVTQKGTDPQGVARMLERADVPLAGDALAANYSDADVKQHLNQGHMLIAQVRTTDRHARDQGSAHYVLIQGMTQRGNYIVSDPLANKTYVASPEQLKNAVLKAPPDGGMLIPVASPAEAKALAAPTAPRADSAGTATPQTLAGNPAARASTQPELPVDTFGATRKPTLTETPAVGAVARKPTSPELAVDTFGSTRRPSLTEMPAVGAVARKPTSPELAVDTFGPVRRPTLAETPAVSPAATLAPPAQAAVATPTAPLVTPVPVDEPSAEAFTATDEVFKGVDTEFKRPTHLTRDGRMEANERRNHYDLDVHYGFGPRHAGRHHTVTPEARNANEIARELLARKARGDFSVYDTLAALENSTSEKDQHVLEMIEHSDMKDPGTGKRMEGDAF